MVIVEHIFAVIGVIAVMAVVVMGAVFLIEAGMRPGDVP